MAAQLTPAGDLELRSPTSGKLLGTLTLGASATAASASPTLALSDAFVSVGTQDGATIYDTSTLREVGEIASSGDQPPTVSFGPARSAMLIDTGGETSVLSLDPRSLSRLACAIANRDLSRAEWNRYVGSGSSYSTTCQT